MFNPDHNKNKTKKKESKKLRCELCGKESEKLIEKSSKGNVCMSCFLKLLAKE